MSPVHRSSDEQSPQKARLFRHTICRCRCLVLFAIATVIAIIFVANMYQDLAQKIPQSYQSLVSKLNQGIVRAVNTTCPNTVAAVDLAKLPPLPTIPANKTHLFDNAMTEKDVSLLSTLMKTFDEIMTNASIPYFINEGSLLGSYRHHTIIPWDDDLDLYVHENHKAKMKEIFKKLSPNYTLHNQTTRFKFYHDSGHTIKGFGWKTPFVEVVFYTENATHLWEYTETGHLRYLKSAIFPLQDRPFLGRMYPAPHDPLAIIKVLYNVDMCYTGIINHLKITFRSSDMIYETPCSALINLVPFVKHVRGPGGAWCEEVLTFRGQVLNTFIRDSSGIPVC